jgi:outer membrane protein assembly factor BamD
MIRSAARRVLAVSAAALIAAAVAGCASGGPNDIVTGGEQNADRYLFERGQASLGRHHWLEAREYFQKLVDTYPTSQYRQDAKLGVGDTYLGENRSDSDVLAAGEFREFLRFYPLAERADYAQYRLALSQVRQVLSPERDQTATHAAIKELDSFVTSYPTSSYMPEVMKLLRQMHDRLSESEYLVGRHYYRTHWYPGAVSRLEGVLQTDPQFTKRDEVYFTLGESLYKQGKKADALPYYQKLVEEFRVSDYLDDAKARINELTNLPADVTPATGSTPDAARAPAPAPAPPAPPAAPKTP